MRNCLAVGVQGRKVSLSAVLPFLGGPSAQPEPSYPAAHNLRSYAGYKALEQFADWLLGFCLALLELGQRSEVSWACAVVQIAPL